MFNQQPTNNNLEAKYQNNRQHALSG